MGIDGLASLGDWPAETSVDELARLVGTAGASVAGRRCVRVREPNPATLIGQGQLRETIDASRAAAANVLVLDAELLPRQQRNIERAFEGKVLDRTGVILDIFAAHAQTAEGRLQVERAQLEYLLPRLSELWVEFSRQRGGIGPFRGPGETQIETDRRLYRDHIRDIDARLKRVREQRGSRRRRRRDAGLNVAALVGYTNAGKSSLLNALTDASVLTENRLFATLDPTTRRLGLPQGGGTPAHGYRWIHPAAAAAACGCLSRHARRGARSAGPGACRGRGGARHAAPGARGGTHAQRARRAGATADYGPQQERPRSPTSTWPTFPTPCACPP